MKSTKDKSEALVEREVLLAIGRHADTLMLKNEVGQGFAGSLLFALQGALAQYGKEVVAAAISATQRHRIVFGLGPGSPDLCGAIAGRAAGLELKRPIGGVVSEVQARWHAAARRRGCFIAVVTSPEEALAAIDRCRRGAVE